MASALPVIEPEPAGAQPRNLWVTARLGAGATAFFYLAFVFAYFYLRAVDTKANWKIGAVHPSSGFGVAIVACLVVSAVVAQAGRARAVPAGAVAIVLGLVAVALQCIEYTRLDFGPASGGYASVFFGWTAMYAVAVLVAMYFLEVQVATIARGDAAADVDVTAAGYEAATFYWSFLAGIGILAWVILYLV